MFDEHQLINERVNRKLANEAVVWRAAISTAVGAFAKDKGRSANKAFADLVKELSGDE